MPLITCVPMENGLVHKDGVLLTFLRDPIQARDLNLKQWDLLLRQARRADLLATVYELVEEAGYTDSVPAEVRRHTEAHQALVQANQTAIRWEAVQVYDAIAGVSEPPILLKGAAYVFAGLPVAKGRIFQDIDILVPKTEVEKVEQALFLAGWSSGHYDAYDQRYYRQWMHELPPLQHMRRGTTVDLHHNILPETGRLKPDAQKLLDAAVTLPVREGFSVRVLAPVDRVLHSAAHLFHEGEFDHGLRDLFDLHRIMLDSARDSGFWEALLVRAQELDLALPLFYATRYTHKILHTPIPEKVLRQLQAMVRTGPWIGVMDFCYGRALVSDHVTCRRPFTGLAEFLLFIRSHYIKMPMHLLVPHLLRKAVKREDEKTDEENLN
jgi:hypothetical protein